MSTPADAFAASWPLETVPINLDELVLEDQIVVEFEKVGTPGRDTLTGRVVERWYGPDEAIVFEDSGGHRWRVEKGGRLVRVRGETPIGESAKIEAVREVVPDGGREIRKLLPCDGDCSGQTEHVHLTKNDVLRDVWLCTVCKEPRAGPILTQSDVEQTIAADGGER